MNTSGMRAQGWGVGAKLATAGAGLVGALLMVFIFVTSAINMQEAERNAVREVGIEVKLLSATIDLLDAELTNEVTAFAKVFASNFKESFTIDPSRPVDVAGKSTPLIKSGATELNLNFSIPDRFTELTEAYATVFVRSGDDFIRVTTSHKKQDGERAIGTMLDRAHPAYRLLLDGQSYYGPAALFGGQYMTRYDPIRDASGKVIGVLYVGINFTKAMKYFADHVKSLKVADSGVFYAISAKPGKDLGTLLIHPSAEGQNLLEAKDAEGMAYIKTMLEKKQGDFHYMEASSGGGARERVVTFAHVPKWDMIIAGDGYLDEITEDARSDRMHYLGVGLLMVALIVAVLVALIRKMVTQPLAEAVKIAETVAAGDLTSKIQVRSKDEIGQLMQAMNHMNASLAQIVTRVRAGTDTIATASAQITSGNLDLSSRTEQQASSLEETASSMEELTSTVKQNADHARTANHLAQSASDVALKGGAVVSQVIDTMGSIDASAKKIVDIISVIDSIAFQTNILALNAAVEAARAGEQGRGFAVVASEVRSLAQRSASAAKEIKALISDSVEKVESGTKLVDQAGETMHEIVDGIKRVTDIMAEIAAASQEQTAGIEQINAAITQMDDVTQQNASLVEEAAAAAQSLQHQASNLAQLVSAFKLDASARSAGHVAPPLPAAAAPKLAPKPKKAQAAVAVREKRPALSANSNVDDWEEF